MTELINLMTGLIKIKRGLVNILTELVKSSPVLLNLTTGFKNILTYC